ncbi:LANO_0D04984g1_1 [Lachancea nothofagi CBS 11611]|uniref:LANO_0D04984g1_1 n=1 Tax=Lachancea nothofagi CBS 11611 TaxID=1266666 RepID=A0A1G4JGT3_9SACH|nr:LANO_0D04984g1_1 [Lachancea nothofagi CBS 11611]
MDPELQAIREARLQELKQHSGSSSNAPADQKPAGESVAALLQPQALERLSRVSLVRPDRVRAVEAYLQQLAARGQISRKVTEEEIVEILNGVARDENRKNNTKIIFDRRDQFPVDGANAAKSVTDDDDDDDDFFD